MALFPLATADAPSPWSSPWAKWKQVLVGAYRESSQDNAGLVAAGVAYYGFLAFVPLIAATILVFGLVADPRQLAGHLQSIAASLPADAAKLVNEQLASSVATSSTKKGLGLLGAIAVALFGARNGAGAVITALNIAYDETETRGFLKLNLIALVMTIGTILGGFAAAAAITAVGVLERLLPFAPGPAIVVGQILTLAVVALLAAGGAATLYRYAPSRPDAGWVWITPGSVFFAVVWLLITWGFGLYVRSFGNYNATYGSIGAVVILITWFYLTSYALLLGAELNSEFEQKTPGGAKPKDPSGGERPPTDEPGARR